MIVNVWLALRADAQALILTRLNWDEDVDGVYSGPVTDRQAKLFRLMADRATVQRLFRVDADTQDWTPWNVYFNESRNVLQKVQNELTQLAIDYPNHIRIVGAWHFDSRQVGTQFVFADVTRDVDIDDPDFVQPDPENPIPVPQITIQVTNSEIVGTSGTPTHPLHARVLELMPDILIRDADGNVISTARPTTLSDVNLLQGQQERRFVS